MQRVLAAGLGSGMLKLLLLHGVVPSPVCSTVRAAGRPTSILKFFSFNFAFNLDFGLPMLDAEQVVVGGVYHHLPPGQQSEQPAGQPAQSQFQGLLNRRAQILDLGMVVDADCRWWMVSPLSSAAQSGLPDDGSAGTSDTRGVSRRVMDTPAFSPHTHLLSNCHN